MSTGADDGTSRIAIGAVLAWLGLQSAGAGAAVALTAASLAVIFTVVFGLPFHDRALDQHSRTCTGAVIEAEATPDYQINSEATVVLRFDCPGVPAHDEWHSRLVESDPNAGLRTGDPVIVEYLSDEPDVARVQGSRAAPAGWVGLGALIFAVFAMAFFMVCAVVPLVGIALIIDGLRHRSSCRAARVP